MPSYSLRGIKAAQYTNTNGTISYGTATAVGDAMTANIELRFAEGRLYAEDTLAEYMRRALGGSISLGVKYIKNAAQTLLFGTTAATRTVGTNTSVPSMKTSAKDTPNEVGITFYMEDVIDGEVKYTCVFVSRCRFGPPTMSYQTMGENIVFNTPTTVGEFMPDHSSNRAMFEVAVCESEANAIAWCTAAMS